MARTNIPITQIVYDDAITVTTATTVDQANGMYIDAKGNLQGLFIEVTNTAGSTKNVIIKAGEDSLAVRRVLGDRTHAVATTATNLITVEGMRHAQNQFTISTTTYPGAILIDFQSGFTGTIRVYQLYTRALY